MNSFNGWDEEDEDNGSEVATFVDYSDKGWWVVGFMVCENGKRPRCLRVIDQDKNLNTLVNRAVYDHGLDPERLWVSPCATALAMLQNSGMKV